MSNVNNSQYAVCAPELAAVMTGSPVAIGTLDFNPVIIIFDNQSATNSAAISTDGGATTWKTFTAGEALVLDMRAAHGIAANFTFPVGTTFTGTGVGGTFSISYLYAKP